MIPSDVSWLGFLLPARVTEVTDMLIALKYNTTQVKRDIAAAKLGKLDAGGLVKNVY